MLDIGCGSGVLSIAAAKLGFAPVLAFDFDPQAVEASERNAADNGVSIDVRQADLREDELPETDLAIANIAAEAALALSSRVQAARVITSGYLVSDNPELEGYRVERRVQDGGWAADLHVRRVSFPPDGELLGQVSSAARSRRPTRRRCASGSFATGIARSKDAETSRW